jgi:seryl-tRNA synthetase
MTERAEILLQRLGLAYRVLLMSTREMGFTQARKYDLEVWAPGVERWLEVSSCSNFGDFQAAGWRSATGRTGGQARSSCTR